MSLRELAVIELERCAAESVCEACGSPFTCGATSAGCWCGEIRLSARMLDQLRARYKACLCRACLEKLALGQEEDSGAPLA